MASDTENPYVGLRPFEREDNLYFFGRRDQTAELLERLHQTRFLGVVGSSGGGKSSLIRAGVIPALLGGFLVESRDRWQIATLKPGNSPLRNLAAALCHAMEEDADEARIEALHKATTENHVSAVREYLQGRLAADTNLLVLIDQFEEIFSFRGIEHDEHSANLSIEQRRARAHRRAESADFVDLMLALSTQLELPVYTILTMRTDFLGDCDVFYGLPEALNRSQYLVPRLSRSQLRDAIVGPALLSRAELSPRLLDEVLNEVGDRPDQLPVLQHAMLRTWDFWQESGSDEALDLEHYQRAGTLTASLKQDANRALAGVDAEITAKIFKCLTDTDISHRRVRRPSQLAELAAVCGVKSEKVREILNVFRQDHRNFVVLSGEESGDPRVDISHESLIRQWDSLRDWVDQEREARDKFLELVERGRSFSDGRKTAPLQNPDLQVALDWRANFSPTEQWAKRYCRQQNDYQVAMDYLDQSHSEAEAKRLSVQIRTWGLRVAYALIAIVALTLGIGYLVVSDEIRDIEAEYYPGKYEQNDTGINEKLNYLARLQLLILELDKAQQGWTIIWSDYFDSLAKQQEHIGVFKQILQDQVLEPLDRNITRVAGADLTAEDRAYLISGIVRRFHLIDQAVLTDQEKFDSLPEIPEQFLWVIDSDIDRQSTSIFKNLYRYYIRLNPYSIALQEEQNRLQSILGEVMSSSQRSPDWLVRYAGLQGFPDVKVGDFWTGSRQLIDQPRVPAEYTLAGLNFINTFLDELTLAGDSSLTFSSFRANFMQQYGREYLKAWEAFAEQFDFGRNKLRGREDWQRALESFATPNNPYFAVMQRIQREIEPIYVEGIFNARGEIEFFADIQNLHAKDEITTRGLATGGELKLLSKLGKVGKVVAKVARKGLKAGKTADNKSEKQPNKNMEPAAKVFTDYKNSLKNLAFNVDYTRHSYDETAYSFQNPGDLASGDGAGSMAWASIANLQKIMGRPRESNRLFWDLYSGPVSLAYQYMQEEAACYLQSEWEDNVLAGLENVRQDRLGETLIGGEGLVWAYTDNKAAPFLSKRRSIGFVSSVNNNSSMHWEPEFLSFLNHADEGRQIVAGEFPVKISALPTGISQSARISPYATYIDLHCAGGVQTLANYNYATDMNFNWSLGSCGDVSLRIDVGDITLRKSYSGQKGFPKFLDDFRDGRRIFTSSEFPEFRSQLENEGVQAIDVNYRIQGQQPVIKMLQAVPLVPPRRVIACWAN